MKEVSYKQRFSEAIDWLRFTLIFFIILLHCYTSVQLPEGNHHIYFCSLYTLAFCLGESGVPSFFFISGYLFFISKKKYSEKISSRIKSLFFPYIIWNSIILLLYVLLYYAGYSLSICGKSIAEYTWYDYLRAFWDRGSFDKGNFVPILIPYWYIRNLFIVSLLSPVFYIIIKQSFLALLFLLISAISWIITPPNAFIPQTIFFFSLGAWFSIHEKNPLEYIITHRHSFIFCFLFFSIGDIIFHTLISIPTNLFVHRISLIFNIAFLILIADYCSRREIVSSFLTKSTFFVFSIHYPIAYFVRTICIKVFEKASDATHILLYILSVCITLGASLLLFSVFKRFFPRIYEILSGNR